MTAPLFDVVLTGEILPGFERARVVRKLAYCLSCDADQAGWLMVRRAVIASRLPMQEARQYLFVLNLIGAIGSASARCRWTGATAVA